MKKLVCVLMSLLLAIAAFSAFAETADTAVFDLSAFEGLTFEFSSGVGGWYTEMTVAPDGTFTGDFHDSEMGETGDEYPNGTVYGCTFHGVLTPGAWSDEDHAWHLTVSELALDEGQVPEAIEDGVRYVTSDTVYGLTQGNELLVYQPGQSCAEIPESACYWFHLNLIFDSEDFSSQEMPFYGLYDAVDDCGFASYEASTTVQ